jgi:hypothetical protein
VFGRTVQGTGGGWGHLRGGSFQGCDVANGFFKAAAAHLRHGLPTDAECGPLGLAVESAFIPVIQVGASHARRLAVGHIGNGGGDRRRNAARAALSAIHHGVLPIEVARRSRAGRAAVRAGQPGR